MTITWSETASASYHELIDKLLERWDVNVALRLETSVNELIRNIMKNHEFCPHSIQLDLRKCVVLKLNSLIYKKVSQQEIFIVAFIQNRMDHDYYSSLQD